MKKYYLFAFTLLISSISFAQNCTPATAGNNFGDTGCVSFTYQNQTVYYKTVRAKDGNVWLQQNLGSTNVATSVSDEGARGDYFQWGRWDDGHQLKNSETSTDYPNPNNPLGLGNGSTLFYIGGGSPWSSDYTGWFANPNQDDTWTAKDNTEITAHNGKDPCKAIGDNWEIPTESDWDLVMIKEGIFPKPDGATNTGIVRGFESNLKIAGAGARKETSFSFEGQRAYIWTRSASANPNFYRYVYLGTSTLSTNGFGGDAKSHGYSVRCVNKSSDLGISNLSKKVSVSIAENPVNDVLKISTLEKLEKIAKTEIIAPNGQLVLQQKEKQNLNVSFLDPGIYLIKVTLQNGQSTVLKMIKN